MSSLRWAVKAGLTTNCENRHRCNCRTCSRYRRRNSHSNCILIESTSGFAMRCTATTNCVNASRLRCRKYWLHRIRCARNLPFALTDYYDVLSRNAFGNYRDLIEEVTLHPAMGVYLSMLGNEKPNPALNIRPDENYARELMQLFSIGLVELNTDGTTRLDTTGQPIPTYDQASSKAFAHVFTGWTYAGAANFQSARPTQCKPDSANAAVSVFSRRRRENAA